MYNLPNLLTISRIAVIPIIFLSIYIHSTLWSAIVAVLFIVAAITDYFDGYLARSRGETSVLGRLLDPIADKLLVVAALAVIMANGMVMRISFIPVVVILCREILVSGLREFLAEVKVGMPVTRLAKWKTGFQMTALAMILVGGWFFGPLGEVLLWIAGVLTFVTGYEYFQKSIDYVKKQEKVEKSSKKAAIKEVKKVIEQRVASIKAEVNSTKTAEKKAAPKKKAVKKASASKKSAAKKTTAKKTAAK